jgi:vancomycin resistance protein VanW
MSLDKQNFFFLIYDQFLCLILTKLFLDEKNLNGEILSNVAIKTTYAVIETDHRIVQQWWGGYTRHNKIWKKITHLETTEEILELVSENNAIMMYNPLLSADSKT